MRVLERVDDREARLDAEEHRRVAVGDVQVDEQQRLPVSSFASAVATLTATVVAADAALGADEGVGTACTGTA